LKKYEGYALLKRDHPVGMERSFAVLDLSSINQAKETGDQIGEAT